MTTTARELSYKHFASPFGIIRVTGNSSHIIDISFVQNQGASRKPADSGVTSPEPLRECMRFLEEYFSGNKFPDARKLFRFLCLDDFTPAGRRVLETLITVPAGSVITYGELAKRSGYPGAARFTGSMMRRNPFPILVPCHRVVPSTGRIGNYSGGVPVKEWLLTYEGIVIRNGKIVPRLSAESR